MTTMKTYIKPSTLMVQVQPQQMIAASETFVINRNEEMNSDDMEAKKNHTYNVWGDDEEQ